jgi:hypothetical protein
MAQKKKWTQNERWPGRKCPRPFLFRLTDPVVNHGVEQDRI